MTAIPMRRFAGSLLSLLPCVALSVALLACKKGNEEAAAESSAEPAPSAAPTSDACPPSFKQLEAGPAPVTCSCPGRLTQGQVYGSDTYTADSSVCEAALHAGVIDAQGGKVKVQQAPGCPAYAASERNGVTTRPWGKFEQSFYFPDKSDGKCPPVDESRCPISFKQIPNLEPDTELTCQCEPLQIFGGMYGTGIYTADSSVCGAAVHAGAIPKTGGEVTVKAAPGCQTYPSSTQNDIRSGAWGPYESSFYFPGHGDGKCSK